MALLRLKMDMPKEVFPSNCSKTTTRGCYTRQSIHELPENIDSSGCISFHISVGFVSCSSGRALTSVKWVSFLTPALCGRNSSCSASSSKLTMGGENVVLIDTLKAFLIAVIMMHVYHGLLWHRWVLPIISAVSVHLLKLHSGGFFLVTWQTLEIYFKCLPGWKWGEANGWFMTCLRTKIPS